jgi:glycerate kinase
VRVVVAPDKYAGTLSAVEAAEAIAAGWRRSAPADDLVAVPVSDGGPGFLDVLAASLGGQRRTHAVSGPLGRPVLGEWLLAPDGTGYVESAQAAGLHLVAPQERDPARATSYGVGELLAAALDAGARRVVVGLGGSATNDGGAGALAALGLQPAEALRAGALVLGALEAVDPGALRTVPHLVAATDVDNPLLGPAGASAVFGPQKGAGPDLVQRLDAALARWHEVLRRALPAADAAAPGAGAAGGLGYALLALGASRSPGIGLVLDAVGLRRQVAAADLVVTGEGAFDWQSLRGKAAAGVAVTAAEAGVPCLVLAGQVTVGRREQAAAGIDAAYAVADVVGSVDAALRDARGGLAALAERVAGTWSR